ncbi:Phage regulatory protein, AlpA family [Lysobacter dokdonensis DS-58]|uniref:Phage regulatory protein, AlpA family n=2 Tax=Noviluteimonas TaxID=3382693 RepID=A0A0A2WQS0_9GAMM|nr:Phage regulatory protein, AlpA family [Lysobacter dokdonensis DS-58]
MIPISKSAWYAGIKAKKYPQPSHALGRVSVWNIEDIRRLIAEASPGAANEQEG